MNFIVSVSKSKQGNLFRERNKKGKRHKKRLAVFWYRVTLGAAANGKTVSRCISRDLIRHLKPTAKSARARLPHRQTSQFSLLSARALQLDTVKRSTGHFSLINGHYRALRSKNSHKIQMIISNRILYLLT